MTEFRVARLRGLLVGAALALVVLGLDVWLAYLARTQPVTPLTVLLNLLLVASVGFLGLLAYWLWGLFHASYALDRNQLVIAWGPTRQVVPMAAIERAVDGAEVSGRAHLRALHWPGYYVGPGRVPGIGVTLFYATGGLRRQVLLVTPAVTYAISPRDKEEFLEAFEVRHRMGATQAVEQLSVVPGWLHWDVWRDRAALGLLIAALALNLALFGYLTYRYAGLPATIALHFNTAGDVDRSGTPLESFFLPFIGLAVWIFNGLAGGILHVRWRELVAAYLLWGGALLVQVLLWIATVSLLSAPYVAP